MSLHDPLRSGPLPARRRWLAGAAALPLTLLGRRLWAAPVGADQAPRLLFVFLRGGADTLSLLVPHGVPFYDEARPAIALPRGLSDSSATPLGDASPWALAPAVRDSLGPLLTRGQLAFVPFAGTHDLSRSHFETQDRIELGQPDEGRRDPRSGFMNRLAQALGAQGAPALQALAFTDQMPIAFRGPLIVGNQSLRDTARGSVGPAQARLIEDMYRDTALAGAVSGGFETTRAMQRDLQREMQAADRQAIAARGFAAEARRIASLMREKVQLGFVDVGGWDTHVNQGGSTGTLATRFGELGRGLAAFADAMGAAWPRTVVVVATEFGRTFRENGSRGTDHGHGSTFLVLGGGLRRGGVAGEQIAIGPASLHQNRDLPVLNEYRAVFGGLFGRLWGLSEQALDAVFPGARPLDLGLV